MASSCGRRAAIGVLITMYNWWTNTIREAHTGYHTPVVQLHLRYGMILFIASEVMFFLAWFWAFFDASLFPSTVEAVGGHWPPKGIEVLDPWGFPLLNTLILLCSGTTVTWAHHSLIHGDRHGLKLGLLLTILLGLLFTFIQAYEYVHAPFAFKGNIYGATFFMATGFHGFHVIVGTIFLIICLISRAAAATSPPSSISGSKRPPGTGISSTSSGCSCSSRSTSGAAGARRTAAEVARGLASRARRARRRAQGAVPALRRAGAVCRLVRFAAQLPCLRPRLFAASTSATGRRPS